MALIFVGSTEIHFLDTMCPKKAISGSQNSHFLNLAYNFFSLKNSKNNPQMFLMLFVTLRIDEDAINEDYHKLIKIILKNSIHKIHESSRGIS